MKRYLAEIFGTCVLTLVVLLSVSVTTSIPTPVLAGLVLGVFVYTIGKISGAQINPAVTLGLWSVNKIKANEAVKYIVSQMLGAFIALQVAHLLHVQIPSVAWSNSLSLGIAEALGAIFFTFGIASVVSGKVNDLMSGFVIGTSLFLGVTIASLSGSAGILNPAVAFGLGMFTPMYVLGPIVGSLIGFSLYGALDTQDKKKSK